MGKNKKNYISIITIAFGFLFGLMLFPSNIKSLIIIITGIFVLVNFFQNKNTFDKKYFLSNSYYFIILLITFLYTKDLNTASLKVQTMISLVAFPLIFSLFNKNDKQVLIEYKFNYLWIYIIGVVLYNTIPFLWFYSIIPNYSFLGMSYHLKNFIMNNIGKYGIHPIYMSMHCCLAVLFSLKLFLSLKKKYVKILLLFLNLILFFFILIYARKGPIIAFLITLVTFFYVEKRKYLKYNLLIVFGLIVLLSLIPTTRNRFLELAKVEKMTVDDSSSSNIRYTIYKNSIILVKEAPFLGYGIGDYQQELNKLYKKNAPILLDNAYNSHNQYLGFLLIGGIILLVTFLFYFCEKFVIAFQTNNTLLILVLVFYGIAMLFENILERENGVIFFAFFINFFSLKNSQE
ncbi:O-antigen ligase family protein [Polaribacter vadi]|uniref:O-antigen ligase family protein n=1 Tax=Polaribacter vadi TaxID=1774273 RepID=UPI0030EDD64D|tara:strand:- start:10616 stop:11824 length:1209 start_codon:yes stop_codon:yes gene_type:complete